MLKSISSEHHRQRKTSFKSSPLLAPRKSAKKPKKTPMSWMGKEKKPQFAVRIGLSLSLSLFLSGRTQKTEHGGGTEIGAGEGSEQFAYDPHGLLCSFDPPFLLYEPLANEIELGGRERERENLI
jgi:hypothetical protein